MKKKLLLLLSLTILAFVTSCSNDDDTIKASSIHGKWNFYGEFYSYDGDVTPTDSEFELNEHWCETKKDYVEFKTNGIAVQYYHNFDCEEQIGPNDKWSLSGKILEWEKFGYERTFKIVELTSETLKLKDIDDEITHYIILKK